MWCMYMRVAIRSHITTNVVPYKINTPIHEVMLDIVMCIPFNVHAQLYSGVMDGGGGGGVSDLVLD